MSVSYKKLQHILIEREISHSQLMRAANISANIISKIKNGQYTVSYTHLDVYKRQVSFPVMLLICASFSTNPRLGSEILANRTPASRAISSVGFWLLADGFAAIVSGRTVKP